MVTLGFEALNAGLLATSERAVGIFIRLWTEENPAFERRFYWIGDVGCFPKPVQKPYPPIVVDGNGRAAIRRAARYGPNWHAFRVPAEALASQVAEQPWSAWPERSGRASRCEPRTAGVRQGRIHPDTLAAVPRAG